MSHQRIRGSLPLAPLSALVDRFEGSFESELRLRSWRESHLPNGRSSARRSHVVPGGAADRSEVGDEKEVVVREVTTLAQWAVRHLRVYAVAPVPEADILLGYPTTNQAYYLSTGTSNRDNFAGAYFPCMGAQEVHTRLFAVGWIMKMTSEGTDWFVEFCRRHNLFAVSLREQKPACKGLFSNFLSKFSYWFQVQTSAALGGEFWARLDLTYLRSLALHYDWDTERQEFVERETPVSPLRASPTPTVLATMRTPEAHEARNTFEGMRDAAAHDSRVLNDAFAKHDALIGRTFGQGASALSAYDSALMGPERPDPGEELARALADLEAEEELERLEQERQARKSARVLAKASRSAARASRRAGRRASRERKRASQRSIARPSIP